MGVRSVIRISTFIGYVAIDCALRIYTWWFYLVASGFKVIVAVVAAVVPAPKTNPACVCYCMTSIVRQLQYENCFPVA